ncbi:hypothetical protein F2Q69_00022424 [Brassica cretica]|uniref:Uncharacterized protein n=1 Tax=Brassica cretica TaxID=69181 RepID=A0A8S9Q3V0_BRACR|nr:hypothetical protein F2Q69_00022424 [Brassica cretica]
MMDVERGRRVDSMDGPHLAKIKESLDSFHSALEEQNQFRIYQIDDDTLSELEQLVDFVDIPTLKNRYSIPNTDSFTQNYDAIVGSRRGRAKFSELMRKFDVLSEHIKRLDSQEWKTPHPEHDRNQPCRKAEVEKTGDSKSQRIVLDSPNPELETSREKGRSNTEEAAIDLEEEEEELEEEVEIYRQEGNNVDRPTTVNIDRQTGNNVDRRLTPA